MSRLTTTDRSRRTFLKQSGSALTGAALASAVAARSYAAENNTIKVALVGCGGRGTGAVVNALKTQGTTKLWAMADVFPARLLTAGQTYYVRVCGYGGAINPNYDLSITGPGTTVPPDSLEPNDSFEFARFLETGDRVAPYLTIHAAGNDYYYLWAAPAFGVLNVDLLFSHAIGDLHLFIYKAAQSGVLALPAGNETIPMANTVRPAGLPRHQLAKQVHHPHAPHRG
jgi:hypothetical protein